MEVVKGLEKKVVKAGKEQRRGAGVVREKEKEKEAGRVDQEEERCYVQKVVEWQVVRVKGVLQEALVRMMKEFQEDLIMKVKGEVASIERGIKGGVEEVGKIVAEVGRDILRVAKERYTPEESVYSEEKEEARIQSTLFEDIVEPICETVHGGEKEERRDARNTLMHMPGNFPVTEIQVRCHAGGEITAAQVEADVQQEATQVPILAERKPSDLGETSDDTRESTAVVIEGGRGIAMCPAEDEDLYTGNTLRAKRIGDGGQLQWSAEEIVRQQEEGSRAQSCRKARKTWGGCNESWLSPPGGKQCVG